MVAGYSVFETFMSVSILSRTISAIVDQRLVLTNDQCGRPLSIGTTWNQIRIGMRCAINPQGSTASPPDPGFFFGLCSGTTNMFGSATTTNALGVITGSTLNYNAGPPPYYHITTSGLLRAKRVGSTLTSGSTMIAATRLPFTADPTTIRAAMVLEITRGSPNYTTQLIVSIGLGVDLPLSIFLAALEAATMADVTTVLNTSGASYNTGSASTIAFDIVAGDLNTINVSWASAVRTFEISDIAYALIA